jgi:hypothetical protein
MDGGPRELDKIKVGLFYYRLFLVDRMFGGVNIVTETEIETMIK